MGGRGNPDRSGLTGMRVALFIGCLNDTLYPPVGRAVVTVLERLGVSVDFPAGQTCCGQMHFNSGYRAACVPLAQGFGQAFAGYDAVVTPSASCASMVREHYGTVAPGLAVPRLWEFTEFLTDALGVTDVGATFPARVALHQTCHSLRLLRVGDRPTRLLGQVRGLELVQLQRPEECCGFGGTFSVKNPDTSVAMGEDKAADVVRSGAQVLASLDTSCLMHIGGLLSRRESPVRVLHLAEILAQRGMSTPTFLGLPPFPVAARAALADQQLRTNLGRATDTIRDKRLRAIAEVPHWQDLRRAGSSIKDDVLARLPELLIQLEANVVAAGGVVHWARDAAEANAIVAGIAHSHGVDEVVKVKSMATQEIELNAALAAEGIQAWETDLAELIVQLGNDLPSHILVPAIHRNRDEIRDIFVREMAGAGRPAPEHLGNDPAELAEAARLHLREKFLRAKVAVSGGNFAVADTGTIVVLESEGNGRMCLTLPPVLITVLGIEKIIPSWTDLDVFLALLPRSSTAERMNPYTSTWTGVTQGDGPQEFHLVLLDNGRTATLADPVGRQALRCIRCSACLNVCPVYSRTGGKAYGSAYPGPIGAILTPQLRGLNQHPVDEQTASLPFASTLCGACYDACPVEINIPEVLTHLRAKVVQRQPHLAERMVMGLAGATLANPRRLGAAQRTAGLLFGRLARRRVGAAGRWRGPGWAGAWFGRRDLTPPARVSFRRWWKESHR